MAAMGKPPAPATWSEQIGRSWAVLRYPTIDTFDAQRAAASWPAVWLGLLALAIVEALGVAIILYGPGASAGYSSLPIGPKLRLPQTPQLPLAALLGSPAQFFVFSGLLWLSARLFGGHGTFKTQSYLLALFWVPLGIVSAVVELVPVVGSPLGTLVRVYMLVLCALALASAQRLSLGRAWAALLLPVVFGLLLGVIVIFVVGVPAALLAK